jgi:hypothetical protein
MDPEQPQFLLSFRTIVLMAVGTAATIVTCVVVYLSSLEKRRED